MGRTVPVTAEALYRDIRKLCQADDRLARLRQVIVHGYRIADPVIALFGEHGLARLHRAVHGVDHVCTFRHSIESDGVFPSVGIAGDIVRGDRRQCGRPDRYGGCKILVAVAVHPDDHCIIAGIRPYRQVFCCARRPERHAVVRRPGHLIGAEVHARQGDTMCVRIVTAAPARYHGGKGLNGQLRASGKGPGDISA